MSGPAALARGEPVLTVVVPAHRCGPALRQALHALAASDLPREAWELVVVDDASGDDTAAAADGLADRVVRLAGAPRGPAFARNRGADLARGALLAFVDADCRVHPDALRHMVARLAEPGVAAVFGAYDTRPPAAGLVSRYRNLVHHYEHVRAAGDVETFWAGCGAVRRDVFRRCGGFDERRYPRPQVEDIELGHRIRDAGHRIVLAPEIRCTHLKRWTLRGGIVTDVRDRGVPWVTLLLERSGRPGRAAALNVRASERALLLLVAAAGAAAATAALARDARWLVAAGAALAVVVAANLPLLGWLARERGLAFALGAIPLRLLYYVLGGVAVVWGTARHLRRHAAGAPTRPTLAAPPAPRRTPMAPMAHLPSLPHLPPALDLGAAATHLERPIAQAVRPMDKRAFGLAVGIVLGLGLALLTAARLLLDPDGRSSLELLGAFLPGYRESWTGAAVGGAWGFAVGAIAGWFAAFVRNLVLAVWLLWLRMRVQLSATHDFLDHI